MQKFDSAKVRFEGGAAAITRALANHAREQGVRVQLNCTINRISTEAGHEVLIEGLLVRPGDTPRMPRRTLHCTV